MVAKILRLVITEMHPFMINQSQSQPVTCDIIHIAAYGADDQSPFCLMLNLSITFMYLGRSMTMVNKPQSWPHWPIISAQTGPDEKIAFHGTVWTFLSETFTTEEETYIQTR